MSRDAYANADRFKQSSLMDVELQWHPAYLVSILPDGGLLLLASRSSDLAPVLLPAEPYGDFIDFRLPTSLQSIITGKPKLASPDVIYLLQQLVDAKLMVQSAGAEQLGFVLPQVVNEVTLLENQQNSHCIQVGNETKVELANYSKQLTLSDFDQFKSILIEKFSAKEIEPTLDDINCQVAFVDDVLLVEPEVLNQENCKLIELSGRQIKVLPTLNSIQLGELKQRLLLNQPLRQSLYDLDGIIAALPIGPIDLTKDLFHAIADRVIEQISRSKPMETHTVTHDQSLPCQLESRTIYEFVFDEKTNSFEVAAHPWATLKTAGIEASLVLRNSRRPTLKNRQALKAVDGGTRIISAEQTLEKLTPFVSPLTGVINQFHELRSSISAGLNVYQTGFFKRPKLESEIPIGSLHQELQQVCLGKGISDVQSKVSGLSEAIERRNALYEYSLNCLLGKASDLTDAGLDYYSYQDLIPYSEQQYQQFVTPGHPESKRKQAALPYRDECIKWLPNWSLSADRLVYLPLTLCRAQTGLEQERFGRWHSNGCSAGNCAEEAILQGLYELIERDATAIWWYNQLEMPAYDMSRFNAQYLNRIEMTLSPEYEFWVLNLTTDLAVPVMGAIAQHKHRPGFVMGFGAHLNADVAAERALTELCQLIPIRDQHSAPFDFNAIQDKPFLRPCASVSAIKPTVSSTGDLRLDIENLVAKLKVENMETLIFDYSKPDTPLSTIKVTVPGLCHMWPQFANKRLYQAPVAMHHRTSPLNELDLNQQLLYI